MARRKIKIYKRYERFWHWCQALLIVLLGLTGFDIHYHLGIFGYRKAVELHGTFAWAFIILVAFTIFWHFTTGEWKQYYPTFSQVSDMIRYYTKGIFRGEPHPMKKTELSKLNPLQRLAYAGLKLVIIPGTVISGFLYYYYNDWGSLGLGGLRLSPVAKIHTLFAFILAAFFIGHVYLTTTGHTLWSNLKAMITGWEEVEEEEEPA